MAEATTLFIPTFYAYLIYGSAAMAGMVSLVLAGIYMVQIYQQLGEMNKLIAQVGGNLSEMGLAVLALKELEKETRTDFANATLQAIGALKTLRQEIEYQHQIAEVHRRKVEASQAAAAQQTGNGEYNYRPAWDQP